MLSRAVALAAVALGGAGAAPGAAVEKASRLPPAGWDADNLPSIDRDLLGSRCGIDRRPSLTPGDFASLYEGQRPVIVGDAAAVKPLSPSDLDAFYQRYKDVPVLLGHGLRHGQVAPHTSTLGRYLRSFFTAAGRRPLVDAAAEAVRLAKDEDVYEETDASMISTLHDPSIVDYHPEVHRWLLRRLFANSTSAAVEVPARPSRLEALLAAQEGGDEEAVAAAQAAAVAAAAGKKELVPKAACALVPGGASSASSGCDCSPRALAVTESGRGAALRTLETPLSGSLQIAGARRVFLFHERDAPGGWNPYRVPSSWLDVVHSQYGSGLFLAGSGEGGESTPAPVAECTLRPGETLYVPAGWGYGWMAAGHSVHLDLSCGEAASAAAAEALLDAEWTVLAEMTPSRWPGLGRRPVSPPWRPAVTAGEYSPAGAADVYMGDPEEENGGKGKKGKGSKPKALGGGAGAKKGGKAGASKGKAAKKGGFDLDDDLSSEESNASSAGAEERGAAGAAARAAAAAAAAVPDDADIEATLATYTPEQAALLTPSPARRAAFARLTGVAGNAWSLRPADLLDVTIDEAELVIAQHAVNMYPRDAALLYALGAAYMRLSTDASEAALAAEERAARKKERLRRKAEGEVMPDDADDEDEDGELDPVKASRRVLAGSALREHVPWPDATTRNSEESDEIYWAKAAVVLLEAAANANPLAPEPFVLLAHGYDILGSVAASSRDRRPRRASWFFFDKALAAAVHASKLAPSSNAVCNQIANLLGRGAVRDVFTIDDAGLFVRGPAADAIEALPFKERFKTCDKSDTKCSMRVHLQLVECLDLGYRLLYTGLSADALNAVVSELVHTSDAIDELVGHARFGIAVSGYNWMRRASLRIAANMLVDGAVAANATRHGPALLAGPTRGEQAAAAGGLVLSKDSNILPGSDVILTEATKRLYDMKVRSNEEVVSIEMFYQFVSHSHLRSRERQLRAAGIDPRTMEETPEARKARIETEERRAAGLPEPAAKRGLPEAPSGKGKGASGGSKSKKSSSSSGSAGSSKGGRGGRAPPPPPPSTSDGSEGAGDDLDDIGAL